MGKKINSCFSYIRNNYPSNITVGIFIVSFGIFSIIYNKYLVDDVYRDKIDLIIKQKSIYEMSIDELVKLQEDIDLNVQLAKDNLKYGNKLKSFFVNYEVSKLLKT